MYQCKGSVTEVKDVSPRRKNNGRTITNQLDKMLEEIKDDKNFCNHFHSRCAIMYIL